MSDDQPDSEFDGIKDKEHLTMVDKLRGKIHPVMDRNDAGQVIYPRREYLEQQAAERKRQADEAKKRGS